MKKFIAIFFTVIYLISIIGFTEIMKVGVLVEHFNETKCSDESVSFFDFIVMHYLTDDGNNSDNEKDSRLPFKSIDSGIIAISGSALPCTPFGIKLRRIDINKSDLLAYEDKFLFLSVPRLIWNPPKVS